MFLPVRASVKTPEGRKLHCASQSEVNLNNYHNSEWIFYQFPSATRIAPNRDPHTTTRRTEPRRRRREAKCLQDGNFLTQFPFHPPSHSHKSIIKSIVLSLLTFIRSSVTWKRKGWRRKTSEWLQIYDLACSPFDFERRERSDYVWLSERVWGFTSMT